MLTRLEVSMTNSNTVPTETLYARLSTVEGFDHFWGTPTDSDVQWQKAVLNPELETYVVKLYDGYETSVVAQGSSAGLRKEIQEWFEFAGRSKSVGSIPTQAELVELLKSTLSTFEVSHEAIHAYKNHTYGVEDTKGWSHIAFHKYRDEDGYQCSGDPKDGQVYVETFIIEVCVPEGWYA